MWSLLAAKKIIFHYFHNLPLSQKLDPRLSNQSILTELSTTRQLRGLHEFVVHRKLTSLATQSETAGASY